MKNTYIIYNFINTCYHVHTKTFKSVYCVQHIIHLQTEGLLGVTLYKLIRYKKMP